MIKPGDRVKVKHETAKAFDHVLTLNYKPSRWHARRGTVQRVGIYNHMIYVRWDDRKAFDPWPERALEKIEK